MSESYAAKLSPEQKTGEWGGTSELDKHIEKVFELSKLAGFNCTIRLSRPRKKKLIVKAKKKAARK
jgi:hypothetical protein